MTDYTWPADIIPSSTEWRLIANTASFVSPLSGTTRTVGRGGDRWACTLVFSNLATDKRARLRAFLAKLRGQANRVVVGDHSYVRRGTQAANVLVNGGSQAGSSLVVDSGTASATLLEGDWVSVGNYMHMITADATFNGSGQATLSITPPLRSSPSDNATVTVVSPTGRFLLADNTVSWSNTPGRFSSSTVELIEDIL